MKTAGNFISSAAEFTAGMEHRMNDFHCRDAHLRMLVHRHTAAVIFHHDGIILLYGDMDVLAVSGQSFVDTVIHNFINQMMKSSRSCASDVHARTLADCFQTFQNLYLRRIILAFCFFF